MGLTILGYTRILRVFGMSNPPLIINGILSTLDYEEFIRCVIISFAHATLTNVFDLSHQIGLLKQFNRGSSTWSILFGTCLLPGATYYACI